MKENKISILIEKPIEEVFQFTTDPKNTHLWFDSIEEEKTNEWPIKLGTIYRNRGKESDWSEYEVVNLEPNQLFELASKDSDYHVRYTYRKVGQGTELEYFEWVTEGALEGPFTVEGLKVLKDLIETRQRNL